MSDQDLEKMLADYFEGGGEVKIIPATKFEEIVNDELRLKGWGDTDTRRRKMRESYKEQVVFETGGPRDDE